MTSEGQVYKVKEWMAIKGHQFVPVFRSRHSTIMSAKRISDGAIFVMSGSVVVLDKTYDYTHNSSCHISSFDPDCINVYVRVVDASSATILFTLKMPIDSII